MRFSDWETMGFELKEKYMPICVNVPTVWFNYQMKKKGTFFFKLILCSLIILFEFYLLKSLPCLSIRTCAEEIKRNELVISSLSQ